MKRTIILALILLSAITIACALPNEPINGWAGWGWGIKYESVKDKLAFIGEYQSTLPDKAKVILYDYKDYPKIHLGITWKAFCVGFINGTYGGIYLGADEEAGITAGKQALVANFGKPDLTGSFTNGVYNYETRLGTTTAAFSLDYKYESTHMYFVFLGTKEYVRAIVSGFANTSDVARFGL